MTPTELAEAIAADLVEGPHWITLNTEQWQQVITALRAAPAVPEGAVAWLVELRSYGQCRGWLTSEQVEQYGWTLDPNKAIRFCRKEDADLARCAFGLTWSSEGATHLSTEHVWLAASGKESAK